MSNEIGEVRITDPTTGAEKGRKPQRMELLPPEALSKLSEVYDFGADKYSDYNYAAGYAWSLSYGALLRHLNAWHRGEDNDAESELPHLLHAAWHCLTLYQFQTHARGTDDRPQWSDDPESDWPPADEQEEA